MSESHPPPHQLPEWVGLGHGRAWGTDVAKLRPDALAFSTFASKSPPHRHSGASWSAAPPLLALRQPLCPLPRPLRVGGIGEGGWAAGSSPGNSYSVRRTRIVFISKQWVY